MYSFPELIKEIRKEAGLTQDQFAKIVGVSSVLIAMIESGQKEVSKNLILKFASALKVHPSSITPFLYGDNLENTTNLSKIEKEFLKFGTKLQTHLIKIKSKYLK